MAEYQVGDRVRIVSEWNNECHQNPEGLMDGWLGATMTIKSWNGAVSYTHLDVYKRQTKGLAERMCIHIKWNTHLFGSSL